MHLLHICREFSHEIPIIMSEKLQVKDRDESRSVRKIEFEIERHRESKRKKKKKKNHTQNHRNIIIFHWKSVGFPCFRV